VALAECGFLGILIEWTFIGKIRAAVHTIYFIGNGTMSIKSFNQHEEAGLMGIM
jgi:hypothetical protein